MTVSVFPEARVYVAVLVNSSAEDDSVEDDSVEDDSEAVSVTTTVTVWTASELRVYVLVLVNSSVEEESDAILVITTVTVSTAPEVRVTTLVLVRSSTDDDSEEVEEMVEETVGVMNVVMVRVGSPVVVRVVRTLVTTLGLLLEVLLEVLPDEVKLSVVSSVQVLVLVVLTASTLFMSAWTQNREPLKLAYLVMVTVEEVELLKTKEDVKMLALGVELEADEEIVEELPDVDSAVDVEVLVSSTELVTTVTD